ncbi:metal ABC transporter solute-binding protein, Zn/Mn family [Fictibacillus barbaricus]|uniref:Zinc ABC transporter substrate-binding protein n=1 Tax=Fictibacillus barbaricus TaxID=182136 RepID=A0ABS2ZBP0_9BACL|nr:zinc ABC transporter substrate-binding protein [Fictibacillus barbaricus]MBN3545340.1 zinc ABC transporter substrate-binding protein [Fictibacillus barbaricus]GGB59763.1 adhesin [Fictibacillus barbaricus]
MKNLGLCSAIILLLISAACGNNNGSDKNDGTLKIYTTMYPLEYFTERIGGKHVEVSSIIPPGADAHTYEPSTKKMVEITEGDAFVYNKLESDEFSSSVADTLKEEDMPIIDGAKGITYHESSEHEEEEHGEHGEEEHGEHEEEEAHQDHGSLDPHIWLDPVLAQQIADNIYNGLVKLKPEAKDELKKNHETLTADLKELDSAFNTKVENAPKNSFIVSHAAYGYWAERYGLEQVAISGLSPSHEPSQKQIQTIIENAKTEKTNYIIFEENVNNKVAAMIKKEVGADTLSLHNLETLTKEDIKNDRDYLSIMKENIDTLSKALQ